MSIFSRITWIDQIKDALGNIIQQGTPVSANNMNRIEGGIEEALQGLSSHIADEDNPHAVTKVQVGLGNADNTSDVNKPVSTAQQSALNLKLNANATAASASKLVTARNIALNGDASGSASFDGSANVTITVEVEDDSHNHVIGNIDGLQTALNAKQASNKKGTGSITTTGWVAESGDNTYKLNLAISGIVATDDVKVNIDKDAQDLASDAELSASNDSYAGGVTFYCNAIPTGAIAFSYTAFV